MTTSDSPEPIEREAARVLLIDPSRGVLLQELNEFRDKEDAVPTATFWITPGGGLQPGETHEDAALRELREECGCSTAIIGPWVWSRISEFRFRGDRYRQRERFYMASASPFDLDHRGLDPFEVGVVRGHRWWQVDEIARSPEIVFYPRELGSHLGRLLTDGPPPVAIDVSDVEAMTATTVLELLDALEARDLLVWLDGGWGVDALLGTQTRIHDDLDLIVSVVHYDRVVEILTVRGFAIDSVEPGSTALLHPQLGRADLHPAAFDSLGNAAQVPAGVPPIVYPSGGFVTGSIAGQPVPCISAEVQLACRLGVIKDDKHRRDALALCERFGLSVPEEWQ